MTGLWYVIEKTGDNPNCLTYNITKSSTPGEYNLEINSIIMSFFGFKSNKKENGIIITDSEKYSASIIIKDSGGK